MMAHSNHPPTHQHHASDPPPRKPIDLFDPRRAARRSPLPYSPSPTVRPSREREGFSGTPLVNSQHVQSFYPPMPNASTTTAAGKKTGISPLNPAEHVGREAVKPGNATRRGTGDRRTPSSHATTRQTAQGMRSLFGGGRKDTESASVRGSGRQRANTEGMRSPDLRYLVAGSSLLAGVVLIGDVGTVFQTDTVSETCQEIVQADARLSRDDLSKLITIPERESKETVQEVVSEPYCRLPSLEVRAGESAERDAYPLAFDPQTWVVLLYEGDEYAGYAFSFQP